MESTILVRDMAKSVMLKGAAKSIHESIRSSMIHLPWSPISQDIHEKEPYLNYEADPRIALHVIYASSIHTGTCVVSDFTDVYILLLFAQAECNGSIYLRKELRCRGKVLHTITLKRWDNISEKISVLAFQHINHVITDIGGSSSSCRGGSENVKLNAN